MISLPAIHASKRICLCLQFMLMMIAVLCTDGKLVQRLLMTALYISALLDFVLTWLRRPLCLHGHEGYYYAERTILPKFGVTDLALRIYILGYGGVTHITMTGCLVLLASTVIELHHVVLQKWSWPLRNKFGRFDLGSRSRVVLTLCASSACNSIIVEYRIHIREPD